MAKSGSGGNDLPGVLPAQTIRALKSAGVISSERPFDPDQIQPASLDLRLGRRAWRIRASFLPGRKRTVVERLADLSLHEIDLTDSAVLETGCVYLIEIQESLDLPDDLTVTANPKSSTGRLDVFTRVILDRAQAFDTIPSRYKGPIYLEVSPQTFPVKVRTGSRLSQIRLRRGLFERGGRSKAVTIHLGQKGRNELIGYRGKHHTAVIDVDLKNACDVHDFWEPIYSFGNRHLILDPGEFYILATKDAVEIPPEFAAEMMPFDPLVGEFRVHYAGFFDPGFGHSGAGGQGARAVLEVRSREVPFILEDGQDVARLIYEPMAEIPDQLYGETGSNYQGQGLKLSKHFRPDPQDRHQSPARPGKRKLASMAPSPDRLV
jgi:dCTP deaminase